jgi:hypothetical protein
MRKKETKCGLIGSEDHTLSFTLKKERRRRTISVYNLPSTHQSPTHAKRTKKKWACPYLKGECVGCEHGPWAGFASEPVLACHHAQLATQHLKSMSW